MKKIQLNEYQQSLFDSNPPRNQIYRIVTSVFNWLLIVGLFYELQNELPQTLSHWLTFGLIVSTFYNFMGLGAILAMKSVVFGFSVALEVDENPDRLKNVYYGIKRMASTGICRTVKITVYRIFDSISDFMLFFLLISNNYLTLGTIFFITVLFQWIMAHSTVSSIKVLISKIPDSLEADGKKPDIGELFDDLISGGDDKN